MVKIRRPADGIRQPKLPVRRFDRSLTFFDEPGETGHLEGEYVTRAVSRIYAGRRWRGAPIMEIP
jgi:hypothetical protein